jgi:hypothetical protein
VLGPLAFENSFVSYKGIQGGFEELWNIGVGRGIRESPIV